MRLSHEDARTRRLAMVAAWLLAALLLVSHARSVRDYLELAGHLGLRGHAEASTPLKQIYPTFATDALTWVRHSLALLEGHDLRLRHTDTDNALEGREVHWNSAWAWTIAGAGKLYQAVNGGSTESSVEKATIWLGPFTLLVLVIALSTWLSRRAGLLAGVFLAAAMTLHERMLEGFFASYCDHHGLLTVSVLGIVLGGAMMGAGWWRTSDADAPGVEPSSRDAVRSGAVLSAISGALGLWVSAASVIPAIGLTGGAGLATTILFGRAARARGQSFDAGAWILWGRIGAAGSLFFYLLEYFPQYLGWRLEVNHPLYALAWLGGGEFIARASERWLDGGTRGSWKAFLWPTLAVLAAPMTIVAFGPRVMALADPFMAHLHQGIGEFQPLWTRLRDLDARMIFQVAIVDALPLAAALATLAVKRRESPMTLVSTTMIAASLLAMAWWQARWDLNASAGEVVLALVLIACWTARRAPAIRWALAAAIVLALYVPGGIGSLTKASSAVAERRVNTLDAKVVLSRDIAAALRASQPSGDIVMLSGPDTSTTVGYYGRFRTLGTPYWENGAGLKAAAAIWSARDDEAAARLLREHGVTHIALLRGEEFIVQYYVLTNPDASTADFEASFGGRVLTGKSLPHWLQPLAYEVPGDLASQGFEVTLYRVDLPR
jgi:hypothetical protein